MNRLFAIPIFIMIFGCGNSKPPKPKYTSLVKEIVITDSTYSRKFGDLVAERGRVDSTLCYDKKGRKTSKREQSSAFEFIQFEYNTNGEMTKGRFDSYVGDLPAEFKYRDNNQLYEIDLFTFPHNFSYRLESTPKSIFVIN